MQISTSTHPQTTTRFTYNPQDPEALPNDTVEVEGVHNQKGKLATDTVILDNKRAIFVGGQLINVVPDRKYQLEPNPEGDFVFPEGHPSTTGANAFGATAVTVDKFNEVSQEISGKPIKWAFGDKQLQVSPETGNWPNAFYARQLKGIHFFDYKNTSTGDSGEVASHETGHAILDALRPGYLQGSGAETRAFHEAFGDNLAMLMTLGNEKAVEALVAQTGGDLSSRRNLLSDMGEAFGTALGRPGGIRTSYNQFTYQDPATLPERGNETQLGREAHDFSRLWSGAFYDVLDGIADANRAAGMSPKQALMEAGEEGFRLLVGEIAKSKGNSETTFKDQALNLMQADASYNAGERQQVIKDVLVRRQLLPADYQPIRERPQEQVPSLEREFTFGPDAGPLAGVKMKTVVEDSDFGLRPSEDGVAAEAEKGARLMLQDGDVLFIDHQPQFSDYFKPDGSAYKAFVSPNEQGQREFQAIPMAFCQFGDHHH